MRSRPEAVVLVKLKLLLTALPKTEALRVFCVRFKPDAADTLPVLSETSAVVVAVATELMALWPEEMPAVMPVMLAIFKVTALLAPLTAEEAVRLLLLADKVEAVPTVMVVILLVPSSTAVRMLRAS